MIKKSIPYLFILLIELIFIGNSFAQIKNYSLEYPFKEYTGEILIEEDGHVWLANKEEIFWFNGHQLKPIGISEKFDSKRYRILNNIIKEKEKILIVLDNALTYYNIRAYY